MHVVTLALGAGDVHPGDAGDEKAMQHVADDEQRRSREQRTGVGADHGPEPRQNAEGGDEIEGEIHAQHQKLALGEIDDPHHAEDDAQADAHQPVDRPDQDPGGERLEKNLEEGSERAHVPRAQEASSSR